MSYFTCARIYKKNYEQLKGTHSHAMRLTDNVRIRKGAVKGECLSWSYANEIDNNKYDPRDVINSYKMLKKDLNAKEYGKRSSAVEMLVIVSKEWITENGGSLHDKENDRNVKLFEAAKKYAQETFGKNNVASVRLDLDEEGGGNVEIVALPTRKDKNGKNVLSPNSFEENIQKKHSNKNEKLKKAYSAIQDDLNVFLKKELDQRLERGIDKNISQAQNVRPNIYFKELENKEKLINERKAAVDRKEDKVIRQEISVESLKRDYDKKIADFEQEKIRIKKQLSEENKKALERERLSLQESNRIALAALRADLDKEKRQFGFDKKAFDIDKREFEKFKSEFSQIVKGNQQAKNVYVYENVFKQLIKDQPNLEKRMIELRDGFKNKFEKSYSRNGAIGR